MRVPFELPAGWPWSTWFFVITLVVYLLQRFPITGMFLMIVAAALWSVILINLGMVGITVEVLIGKVSPLWLAIPLVWFGGYYAAYTSDQAMFAKVRQEVAEFNVGKSLPFDPARQDLVIKTRGDGLGTSPRDLVDRFDVPRAFDTEGRMWMVGTEAVCKLVNSDRGFLSAGIQGHMITRQGKRRFLTVSTGYCMVSMPGKPDKPVVEVEQSKVDERRGTLPVSITTLVARDVASGRSASARTGLAAPLKRFPMWAMGCSLDSGTPAWRCFHQFLRDSFTQILPDMPRYSAGTPIVARMLGLAASEDFASRAIGVEAFQPIADRIEAEKVAKETAILEQMLAAPTGHVRDSWLWHLPNRPAIVAPYAPRIFDALETLQTLDRSSSETGKNLWRLVEKMSEETIAPYRQRMANLMRPDRAKPWTRDSYKAYLQLDAGDPDQRNILFERLTDKGRVVGELLPPFCRMGTSAPDDIKRRLLQIWRDGAPEKGKSGDERRNDSDLLLYLTLARMGLKHEAGKVEQRYEGSSYRDVWEHITPDSPEEVCVGFTNELSNYFRKAGFRN